MNDPIEGYVKVFWQEDKFAWEGLLRNYIYSLAQTILQYLLEHDIHVSPMINMKQFNNVPLVLRSFEAFKDEDQWRHEYWKIHEIKTYQKLKAWKSEQEYRIVLTDTFHDFSTQGNRKLQYDPKCLRGIILGNIKNRKARK